MILPIRHDTLHTDTFKTIARRKPPVTSYRMVLRSNDTRVCMVSSDRKRFLFQLPYNLPVFRSPSLIVNNLCMTNKANINLFRTSDIPNGTYTPNFVNVSDVSSLYTDLPTSDTTVKRLTALTNNNDNFLGNRTVTLNTHLTVNVNHTGNVTMTWYQKHDGVSSLSTEIYVFIPGTVSFPAYTHTNANPGWIKITRTFSVSDRATFEFRFDVNSTVGRYFDITGIKVELGSTSTPYVSRVKPVTSVGNTKYTQTSLIPDGVNGLTIITNVSASYNLNTLPTHDTVVKRIAGNQNGAPEQTTDLMLFNLPRGPPYTGYITTSVWVRNPSVQFNAEMFTFTDVANPISTGFIPDANWTRIVQTRFVSNINAFHIRFDVNSSTASLYMDVTGLKIEATPAIDNSLIHCHCKELTQTGGFSSASASATDIIGVMNTEPNHKEIAMPITHVPRSLEFTFSSFSTNEFVMDEDFMVDLSIVDS